MLERPESRGWEEVRGAGGGGGKRPENGPVPALSGWCQDSPSPPPIGLGKQPALIAFSSCEFLGERTPLPGPPLLSAPNCY